MFPDGIDITLMCRPSNKALAGPEGFGIHDIKWQLKAVKGLRACGVLRRLPGGRCSTFPCRPAVSHTPNIFCAILSFFFSSHFSVGASGNL